MKYIFSPACCINSEFYFWSLWKENVKNKTVSKISEKEFMGAEELLSCLESETLVNV